MITVLLTDQPERIQNWAESLQEILPSFVLVARLELMHDDVKVAAITANLGLP